MLSGGVPNVAEDVCLRSEMWADADELLVDRKFPELEDPAEKCIAVHTYPQQLGEPQVSFSV